jgi:tetratricopeptide (TPR) repeat protein
MKPIVALLVATYFLTLNLYSQNSQGEVEKLISQADSLRSIEKAYSKAAITIEKAIALAKRNGSSEALGNALIQKGRILKTQKQYSDAAVAYREALLIRNSLNDSCGVHSILNNYSSLMLQMGNADSALIYARKAVTGGKRLNCTSRLPNWLSTLANVYDKFEMFDSAIIANREGILLAIKGENTHAEITARYGLAKRYFYQNDYIQTRLALDTLLQRFPYEDPQADSIALGETYELIGASYYEEDRLDSSTAYYDKAAIIYHAYPEYLKFISEFYFNLGSNYAEKANLAQAEECYTKASELLGPEDSSDFSYLLTSLKDLMHSLQAQKLLNSRLNIALYALLFIAISVGVLVFLLFIKEKKNTKLVRENHQLKHDLVKNNLKIILSSRPKLKFA